MAVVCGYVARWGRFEVSHLLAARYNHAHARGRLRTYTFAKRSCPATGGQAYVPGRGQCEGNCGRVLRHCPG